MAAMRAHRRQGPLRALVAALGLLLALLGARGPRGFLPGLPSAASAASARKPRRVGLTSLAAAAGGDAAPDRRLDTVRLKVLTPEGTSVMAAAEAVSLPGVEGRLGILRGHAPLLAPCDTGVLRYKTKGVWVPIIVMGGYASVDKNTVTVLCHDLLAGDAIPRIAESKAAFEQAAEAMGRAETPKEKLDAKDALKKASAILQAAAMLGDARAKPKQERASIYTKT